VILSGQRVLNHLTVIGSAASECLHAAAGLEFGTGGWRMIIEAVG